MHKEHYSNKNTFLCFCHKDFGVMWSVKPRNKGLHSHNELQYLSGGNALHGRIKVYSMTPQNMKFSFACA